MKRAATRPRINRARSRNGKASPIPKPVRLGRRPRRIGITCYSHFGGSGVVATELGVALDVLVAMLVLGVFFFQIREQFDSLDLHHLESLKEEQ